MAKLINTPSSAFPDEGVDPKVKVTAKWLLPYCQAVLSASTNMPADAIGYPSRARYKIINDYVRGRQNTAKYKKRTSIDADPNVEDKIITDDSIVPVLPRLRRTALGLLEKVPYKLQVNTVDPAASLELLDKQNARKARMHMRQQFAMLGAPEMAQHPTVARQPGDADDEEGLEVMGMGERHEICADAQDAIRAVFNINTHEAIKRKGIADLFDYGVAVIKDDTTPTGIAVRNCDMANMILSYCNYPDFSDMIYAGEIRAIPVSQLEAMSCGQIKKGDIEDLYKQVSGLTSQWFSGWNGGVGYDNWRGQARATVLDLEILSNDTIEREESKDRYGNMRYGNATKDEEKRKKKEKNGAKFTKVTIQNVYRVKWVVGTDIIFDCGKQVNVKRDDKNPALAKLSYHPVATELNEMRAYSRTEMLIPGADDIQMIKYRLEKAMKRVKNTTYGMDISGIEAIDIGAGGNEMMSALDVIQFWIDYDILIYRGVDTVVGGQRQMGPPITAIPGGLSQEFNEYRLMTADKVEQMQRTVGLNELTDGSTPNAKTLTTVANLAAAGTNNALSDIYFADKMLNQKVAMSVLLRVQNMIRDGRGDEIAAIIGRDSARRLGGAPALDAYRFGISIEDAPSPDEEQAFTQALMTAVGTGQITVDEQFMAQSLRQENLRKAELYLAYRVRSNKAEQKAEAEKQIAMNAQAQQQSAQVAEQAKQQTIQIQLQADIAKLKMEHELKMQEIQVNGQFLLEGKRIDASGRVESSFVQAKERDASNIRTNKTKLLGDGRGEQMGDINIPADLESRVAPVTDAAHPNLPMKGFSFLNPVERQGVAQMPNDQQAQAQQMQQQLMPEEAEEAEGPMPDNEQMEQPDMQMA